MTADIVMLAGPATERVEERAKVQQQWKGRLPTAAQVMSRHPAIVDAQTSLFSAWGKLHGEQNRHLVVIDHDVRPIGVLDERDIALEWPPGPIGAHHLPVHKLLRFRSRPQVRAEENIVQVAQTMLTSREDALPVIDEDGRLLGLITVWHCVELIAGPCGSDQQQHQTAASTPPWDRSAE